MGEKVQRADELVRLVTEATSGLAWEPTAHEHLQVPQYPSSLHEHQSLAYLHRHWNLPEHDQGNSRGLRAKLRRLAARVVFASMRGYLHEERELFAQMVQLLDCLARRCDELAQANQVLVAELDARFATDTASLARLAGALDAIIKRTSEHGEFEFDAGSDQHQAASSDGGSHPGPAN